MTQSEIIEKVSEELQLPVSLVQKAYNAYWQFVRTSISELPLKEDLTEEQFNTLKVSFNIPSIGKLHCNYNRYLGMKKRFDCIKKIKTNDKYKED